MPFTALLVHVPVDKLDIVGCDARWRIVAANLAGGWEHVNVRFRLQTPASVKTFWRNVSVHTVTVLPEMPHTYHFTGVFCGEVVSGNYNTYTKSGFFSID